MRSLGHCLVRSYSEGRLAARKSRLAGEISQVFHIPVHLELTGSSGLDSIYFVVAAALRLGVVRLVNPFNWRWSRRRPARSCGLWWFLAADRRLRREWDVYARLGSAMLTPTSLWRTHDAILCNYYDGKPVSRRMVKRPDLFWSLGETALRGLRRIHDHGIAHMDAKLGNILTDRSGKETVFIDFDCTPPPWVDFPQQKAYDYLKLTDSALKLMPRRDRAARFRWVDALDRTIDEETRRASLDLVYQRCDTTRHVLRDREFCRALRAVFLQLDRDPGSVQTATPQSPPQLAIPSIPS